MILAECGFVLAFSSSHSGDHFSWLIFIFLMLVLSCIAEVIKLNLRFERCSSKIKCCKNTDFFLLYIKATFAGYWSLGREVAGGVWVLSDATWGYLPVLHLHALSLEYWRMLLGMPFLPRRGFQVLPLGILITWFKQGMQGLCICKQTQAHGGVSVTFPTVHSRQTCFIFFKKYVNGKKGAKDKQTGNDLQAVFFPFF